MSVTIVDTGNDWPAFMRALSQLAERGVWFELTTTSSDGYSDMYAVRALNVTYAAKLQVGLRAMDVMLGDFIVIDEQPSGRYEIAVLPRTLGLSMGMIP